MFDSLHNVTLSRPRIVIESLLEHFIFLHFLGGGPPNPPQGEVYTHKYFNHKISNPHLQILYTPMLGRSVTITVYQ